MSVTDKSKLDTSNAQLAGLSLLVSRLVSEVSAARCKNQNEQAEWIARLYADTNADIERLQFIGLSEDGSKQVKQSAAGAVQFVLGRLSFRPNA